jgi:hypothetical protein
VKTNFHSRFQPIQRVFSGLVLSAFVVQISGCENYISTKHIDSEFSRLGQNFKEEAQERTLESSADRLKSYESLKGLVTSAITAIAAAPKLTGKLTTDPKLAEVWIKTNQPVIEKWYEGIEAKVEPLRMFIYNTSKTAFEAAYNPSSDVRDSVLVLYALHYYRNMARTLFEVASPLMMGAGSEDFKNVPGAEEFKKKITDIAFAQLGMTMLVDQDIQKTLSRLDAYRQKQSIPRFLENRISNLQKSVASFEGRKKARFDKHLAKLSAEDRAEVQTKIDAVRAEFASKSLLYTPGSNSSVLKNILIWIGNLTWGLINTLVGVGIIIATMIVSPFSEYVDFPRFAMARSGRQIYVDVSGMGPYPAKLSMGIFEFDNHTGYGWASHHEGGHAAQSAILGPFYLPVVLASYLTAGWGGGFIEDWADAWAH